MRVPARILALLVLAALLASASAWARVSYVCRMSGRVGPSCCCAHGKKTPPGPTAVTEVRGRDCCDPSVVRVVRGEALLVERERLPAPSPPAVVSLIPVTALLPPAAPRASVAPRRSRAPPDTGPPLYLRHCSLLD